MKGYIYISIFFFGFLNNKLLSPFFTTYIGKMVNKSYKVSIMALIFILSKTIEAIGSGFSSSVTGFLWPKENAKIDAAHLNIREYNSLLRHLPFLFMILVLVGSIIRLRF